MFDEAEENNLPRQPRWARWSKCSLCEQDYHSVVKCAIGWACWTTYVGRPEADRSRGFAMTELGNGLFVARQYADALPVVEAQLSMKRRLGASEASILVVQNNLANTYHELGRLEQTLSMREDVYIGWVKLRGVEHENALISANNYSASLLEAERYVEARSALRKVMLVAQRVLGESAELTLKMRWIYARALYEDASATLADLSESVTTLEIYPIARRVLGGAHPLVADIGRALEQARAVLAARKTPPLGSA